MGLVAVILLIAGAFMLMTAGAGDRIHMGMKQSNRSQSNRRTGYAAYGLVQLAVDKLSDDMNYAIDPVETGVVADDPELIYELGIYNNYSGTATITAPDGTPVPRYMVYIRAKADYRDYPGRYTSVMYSKAYVGSQGTNYPIVGTKSVTISNSTVDGKVVAAVAPWNIPKLYDITSARIATNSVDAGAITINGTSAVNCSIRYGPYGNPSVVNLVPPAVINASCTVSVAPWPTRVPRFHPPRNPVGATTDLVYTGSANIPPGDYHSLNVTGAGPGATTINLNPGQYYFATNVSFTNCTVSVPGVTGSNPCDIYVGESFHATNSQINWEQTMKPVASSIPPGVPHDTTTLRARQENGGPRTMRVLFVGSGAPKFNNCSFLADNCKMALFGCGKAMTVELRNGTICWGGFKGFEFTIKDSELHYHYVAQNTP